MYPSISVLFLSILFWCCNNEKIIQSSNEQNTKIMTWLHDFSIEFTCFGTNQPFHNSFTPCMQRQEQPIRRCRRVLGSDPGNRKASGVTFV